MLACFLVDRFCKASPRGRDFLALAIHIGAEELVKLAESPATICAEPCVESQHGVGEGCGRRSAGNFVAPERFRRLAGSRAGALVVLNRDRHILIARP